MRSIGIDFGTKRTGVAVSDEEGRIAFPLAVIPTTRMLAEDILKLAEDRGVKTFVLGNSIDGSGKENPIMGHVHLLAERLKAQGEVFLEDERYSSQHASRGHEENEMHDASTAAIILQGHLDRRNKKPTVSDPYALP